PDEAFEIGGSRVLRSSPDDCVTIVAAGITVPEAVKAWDVLSEEGIAIRVIDAYSIKPIDEQTLRRAAAETSAIVTVEDHWAEGGLGDAVLGALAGAEIRPPVTKLAVTKMPGSGKPDEMLRFAGIDAPAIIQQVRNLVSRRFALSG
ncbi:MAG: transketolase C-terminal domain-containing protein, partial [Actinomycetota bacterium]